ncbi:MAG: ABC transporter permease [Phycisphaerales bacterium]
MTRPEPDVFASALRAAARFGPLVGLAAVVLIFFVVQRGSVPSFESIRTVAVHTVIVAIVGIGMTLVILSGGIDLSVGSTLAFSCVITALAARAGWPLPGVVLAGCAAGLACGLYNGLLVATLGLPPFIVTLGTLGFFRGIAKWVSHSRVITGPTLGLDAIVQPRPPLAAFVFAPAVWLMLAIAALATLVVRRTIWGRHVTAVGSNTVAAAYAGVHVGRTRAQVYAVCGLLVGFAGVLQFGRLTVGDPTIAVGIELDAVAAAVIGGASLSGGRGSVFGTVCGAFMMAYLRNRCTDLQWPNYVQEIIVGHIILLAVGLDFARRSSQKAGGAA